MNARKVTDIVLKICDRINTEKVFLTELDNVIGDGDHGINLSRGFCEVKSKLEAENPATPADVVKTVSMVIMSKTGGAAGALYGTAFLYMAKSLVGKEDVSVSDLITALKSGATGVSMRGKSTAGEKTMLDAMLPAVAAMEESEKNGKSTKEILRDGVVAAQNGVEYTKTIIATKGRASYVGERSIGHQDPGATSFTMMLEELLKCI